MKNKPSPKKKYFPKISLTKKILRTRFKNKPNKKFICDTCETRFPNWWERRAHWIESGHKAPEKCRWCGKETFTLQSHLCKVHWGTACICPHCGQMLMYQEDLKIHQLQHDGTEYRCIHCGHKKKNEQLLRSHVQNHFLSEKYGCNLCEKRFKQKKNLEKHLKHIHFICQYCGNTCKNSSDLKKHAAIHDDLKCVFCQKVFSQKNRLKYHYQLLHGHQDFYQCPRCFQRFAKKSVLLDHIKLKHGGVSNFTCKICALPFLYWQQYKNHFDKVHLKTEEENKINCSFCDFSTNSNFKLKCHVEKSSGLRFFCKKCKLRFDCKGRFEEHMKNHDGESVWTCDFCSKSYKSDDILRHHMTVSHIEQLAKTLSDQGAQIHPCLEQGCEKYYPTKSNLARHIRRKHPHCYEKDSNSSNVFISSLSEDRPEDTHSKNSNIDEEQRNSDTKEDYITDQKEESNPRKLNIDDEKRSGNGNQSDDSSIEKGYHHIIQPLDSIIEVNIYYCDICKKFWYSNLVQFRKHMSNHKANNWLEICDICNISLDTQQAAVQHFVEKHLKVKYTQ